MKIEINLSDVQEQLNDMKNDSSHKTSLINSINGQINYAVKNGYNPKLSFDIPEVNVPQYVANMLNEVENGNVTLEELIKKTMSTSYVANGEDELDTILWCKDNGPLALLNAYQIGWKVKKSKYYIHFKQESGCAYLQTDPDTLSNAAEWELGTNEQIDDTYQNQFTMAEIEEHFPQFKPFAELVEKEGY